MRFGCVPELDHERMTLERLLHEPALDALASAVYQAHFSEPRFVRRGDVLLDNRLDVARRERVKVERVLNRDAHSLAGSW